MLDVLLYALLALVAFYAVAAALRGLGNTLRKMTPAHHVRTVERKPVVVTKDPVMTFWLLLVTVPGTFFLVFGLAHLMGALQ